MVFLSGAAPGDVVEAELTGEGRFERTRALRVVERGGTRVDPPCPIVDCCGGCPVQQISYQAQLAAKEELAADALERIGGFARGSYRLSSILPSPKQFHYRRRARMHRAAQGRWGFARKGAVSVEPVEDCLLFEPLLQDLADAVRAVDLRGATDLGLLAGDSKGTVDLRGDVKGAEKLLALPLVKGVTVAGRALGDPVIVDGPLPNGARLRLRPDTFAQANRSALPLLQSEVASELGESDRVLELFCGSGTLTLPLLRSRSVTAVERAGPSLTLLRRSADEAGLEVRLIAGDAAEVARGYTEPVDAVLLDPPRTGAAEVMPFLNAPRIVYVSCDGPTLARDARLLTERGYRLIRAAPLDLFPQTAHFEIVATFAKRP
ncbi:MAG: class I SAM-dependent RNA methyltransferase [Deltaproteobacteria bacterium]|nr:MAG: class I SAM-dependent RNA methyltransferase [Deltaproteobacteria bacterium]